jgi:hypothetical protein
MESGRDPEFILIKFLMFLVFYLLCFLLPNQTFLFLSPLKHHLPKKFSELLQVLLFLQFYLL